MRRTCGAGADGPRRMLAMLEAVAALEPSHTRRSERAGPAPAVLDPAAARLCRPAGRRDPARRRRAGALRRHRHAGGDGGMRPRGGRRRQSPSQRISLRRQGAASDPAVSAGRGDRLQRRGHRRPAARRPPHRRADEPAVLGNARCRPQPARRRPAPCPLRRLDAAAGRPAGHHHVGPLRAGRRRRPSRSPGPLRLHHGDRRPRLRTARHRLRHPPHRAGARRGTAVDLDGTARAANAAELLDAVIAQVPTAAAYRARAGPVLVRPATCSASRSRRSRQRAGVRSPYRLPRRGGPTTGGRSPNWSSSPVRSSPTPIPIPPPTTPAPTPHGGRAPCGCRARSSTRRRWSSPPPWPPCRIPCRHTGRSCPSES